METKTTLKELMEQLKGQYDHVVFFGFSCKWDSYPHWLELTDWLVYEYVTDGTTAPDTSELVGLHSLMSFEDFDCYYGSNYIEDYDDGDFDNESTVLVCIRDERYAEITDMDVLTEIYSSEKAKELMSQGKVHIYSDLKERFDEYIEEWFDDPNWDEDDKAEDIALLRRMVDEGIPAWGEWDIVKINGKTFYVETYV